MSNTTKTYSKRKDGVTHVRFVAVTGMLSAIAFILMFLDFSIPIMPSFIKMDVSELPALIATFAYGPLSGVCVCLIKNLLHLTITTTGGVGELSNFLLGVCLVVPAGLVYKNKKNKKNAIIGTAVGAVAMGVLSIPVNVFITYPVYYNFMPQEVIVAAYQAILPSVKNILQCLIVFNAPFTFVKGAVCSVITMLIYKPLSPILHGNK
ncbi:MAG: ECF transporter S component [Lachnospiraceae bacterium]|nr:ECF transporter S component [Lachnospiraceae bacterium]